MDGWLVLITSCLWMGVEGQRAIPKSPANPRQWAE